VLASALAPNGLPVPSAIGLTHLQMQFATQDLDAVRRFYVETLGFSNAIAPEGQPFVTVFLTPSASVWFMTPSQDQAPESWQPPGEPVLYVFVSDVDRAYGALLEKGVVFDQPPRDMPWGHRMAILRDPEGRRICLATHRQPTRG
jgi:catechol 2,3-dioxygenase-like lactoylglutathione lyase family enzyme